VYSELGPGGDFQNLSFQGGQIGSQFACMKDCGMFSIAYLFECAESARQTDESIDACCHLDFAFMHRIYKDLEGEAIY
jgi:hypothetical protein